MREFIKEKAGLVLLGCLVLGAGGYFAFGGSEAQSEGLVATVAPVRKAGPKVADGDFARKPRATADKSLATAIDRPEPRADPIVNSGRNKKPRKTEPEKLKKLGTCG